MCPVLSLVHSGCWLTAKFLPSSPTPSITVREERSPQKSLWDAREEVKFPWYKGILKLDMVKRDPSDGLGLCVICLFVLTAHPKNIYICQGIFWERNLEMLTVEFYPSQSYSWSHTSYSTMVICLLYSEHWSHIGSVHTSFSHVFSGKSFLTFISLVTFQEDTTPTSRPTESLRDNHPPQLFPYLLPYWQESQPTVGNNFFPVFLQIYIHIL